MDRLEQLESRMTALTRLVLDLHRDVGPLKNVTTIEELKKHWHDLRKTPGGVIYMKNWYWRFATHPDETLRLEHSVGDKLRLAICELENQHDASAH